MHILTHKLCEFPEYSSHNIMCTLAAFEKEIIVYL